MQKQSQEKNVRFSIKCPRTCGGRGPLTVAAQTRNSQKRAVSTMCEIGLTCINHLHGIRTESILEQTYVFSRADTRYRILILSTLSSDHRRTRCSKHASGRCSVVRESDGGKRLTESREKAHHYVLFLTSSSKIDDPAIATQLLLLLIVTLESVSH